MSLAYVALNAARTHLNDDDGVLWPDTRLLPKLQEAYRELTQELVLFGIPIVHAVTSVLTVPTFTTADATLDLVSVSGFPKNILEPIYMKERAIGQQTQDFVDMTQVDFLPNVQRANELVWWAWIGGSISVLGALNPVEIQLRYKKNLTPPITVNDDLIVPQSENFLSYRTASLAIGSANQAQRGIDLYKQAMSNLSKVIRINVKQLQDLPANRRPYHRGRGRNRVLRDF